jgi:hypothetical protein
MNKKYYVNANGELHYFNNFKDAEIFAIYNYTEVIVKK